MVLIEDLSGQDIKFIGVSHVVELFPAPLPSSVSLDGVEHTVDEAENLFRMSPPYGTTELFLAATGTLTARTSQGDHEITAKSFVEFQLKLMTTETLYYLINKTDVSLVDTDLLDWDSEYARDPNFDPEGWLNEYDEESLNAGIAFINRLREQAPDQLYEAIAVACLDHNTGLTQWLETSLVSDFDARINYDNWDVRLAIVFTGKFFPYFEYEDNTSLKLDDYIIKDIEVRNYDEG